jgi:hypothetical protein
MGEAGSYKHGDLSSPWGYGRDQLASDPSQVEIRYRCSVTQ